MQQESRTCLKQFLLMHEWFLLLLFLLAGIKSSTGTKAAACDLTAEQGPLQNQGELNFCMHQKRKLSNIKLEWLSPNRFKVSNFWMLKPMNSTPLHYVNWCEPAWCYSPFSVYMYYTYMCVYKKHIYIHTYTQGEYTYVYNPYSAYRSCLSIAMTSVHTYKCFTYVCMYINMHI